MSLPIYPMIRPSDARTLNRLASDVSRLDADLVRGRNAYPDDNKPFMAYISGNLAGAHSWYKLVSMDDGDNDQDGWGLEGTVSGSGNVLPAYALDGSTVATGSVVLMWFADVGSEMRFVPPPGTNWGYATAATPGVVNIGAQEFGGLKTFTSGLRVPGTALLSLPIQLQSLTIGELGGIDLPGLFRGDAAGGSQSVEFDGSRMILQHRDNTGTPDGVTVLYAIRDAAGALRDGFTGTGGGGDEIVGGITVAAGTAPDPADIDGGTWT